MLLKSVRALSSLLCASLSASRNGVGSISNSTSPAATRSPSFTRTEATLPEMSGVTSTF